MRFLVLTILLSVTQAAMSESLFDRLDKYYAGGGINSIRSAARNTAGNDGAFTSLELIGGYKYNGYLGAEIRVGFGVEDEEFPVASSSDTVTASIDYHSSIYWRPETANEIAKIYGLVGFSSVSIDNGGTSSSESGLSLGGGFGFVFSEDWNLNFEYRSIINADALDLSSISANVDYRF